MPIAGGSHLSRVDSSCRRLDRNTVGISCVQFNYTTGYRARATILVRIWHD